MEYIDVILRSGSVIALFAYSLYAFYYAANIFERRKRNKILYIVTAIFNTAFIFLGNYLSNPLYVTYFLGIFILTIQFYFFIKRNIREVLLGSSIFILHLICIQMLVISIMSMLLNVQPYDMMNDYNLFSLNILSTFMLAIVALISFKGVISNSEIRVIIHNKQQSILVSIICIYIVLYSCFDSYAYTMPGKHQYLSITMIAIQIVSLVSFYLLIMHSLKIGEMSHYKNKHDILKEELEETIRKEEVLKEIAYKDNLTGCFTKIYSSKYLDTLVAKHVTGYCIVYIDLNHLKLVNDSYGHNEGDYYIKKVAAIITGTFRKEDLLARIGGDEFLLVVNDCKEGSVLEKMKLVERELSTCSEDGLPYTMEISFGILYVDESKVPLTQAELLDEVDYKMYLDKQKKRNTKLMEVDK